MKENDKSFIQWEINQIDDRLLVSYQYIRPLIYSYYKNSYDVDLYHKQKFLESALNIIKIFINILLSLINLILLRSKHLFIIPSTYKMCGTYHHFGKIIDNLSDVAIIEVPQTEQDSIDTISVFKPLISSSLINAACLFYQDDQENEEVKIILNRFFNHFDLSYDKNFVDKCIRKFTFNTKRQRIVGLLIKFIKPRTITLSSYYDSFKMNFIIESKHYNVNVFEVQHGHIYDDNIFYLNHKYLYHDRIFVWNDYYSNKINTNSRNIGKVIGNTFITEKKNIEIPTNNILVIDQYTMQEEVIELISILSQHIPNVYVKLHPKSYLVDGYLRTIKEKGVEVVPNIGRILDIGHNFEKVAGFYSTGLLESLLLGVDTYIYHPEKNDYYKSFVNEGYMNPVSKLEVETKKWDFKLPNFKNDILTEYQH